MEENKDCKTPEEVYAKWKSSLEKQGSTPAKMVSYYREIGMTEYADKLASVISKLEAFH